MNLVRQLCEIDTIYVMVFSGDNFSRSFMLNYSSFFGLIITGLFSSWLSCLVPNPGIPILLSSIWQEEISFLL